MKLVKQMQRPDQYSQNWDLWVLGNSVCGYWRGEVFCRRWGGGHRGGSRIWKKGPEPSGLRLQMDQDLAPWVTDLGICPKNSCLWCPPPLWVQKHPLTAEQHAVPPGRVRGPDQHTEVVERASQGRVQTVLRWLSQAS